MVTNSNEIVAFLHCGLCLEEMPYGVSPRDYARLEVGWTPAGLQIWCTRHDVNVMNIDFEGHQHPANVSRPRTTIARLDKSSGAPGKVVRS